MKKAHQKLVSLLAASMLSLPTTVSAASADWETMRYGNEVYITAYLGNETNIVCPSQQNGFPVSTISEGVFQGRTIESIVLPQNLRTVFTEAFQGTKIKEINLPSTVTTVWHGAFLGSTLEAINGEENLTTIGDSTFMNTNLTNVDLSSCQEINVYAFCNCQLENITWPKEKFNAGVSAFENNHLKTADLRNLKSISDSLLRDNELTHVQLSDDYVIYAAAFNNNQLPDNEAFFYATADSTRLVSYGGARRSGVEIPRRTTCIGTSAFAGCSIESIEIPDTVTELEASSFFGNKLTSVTIPTSISSIGANAFSRNLLTTLTIPSSIKTIGAQAFQFNDLSTVTIPSTVTAIGANAFSGNPNLKTIYMEDRSDLSGMTLGSRWNGDAEIVFGIPGSEPTPTPPDSPSDGTTAEIAVHGQIASITSLDIDVPLQIGFSIGADRQFASENITIRNNSPFPITTTAVSLEHIESSPSVVAPSKFTPEQWPNLNGHETTNNIAFGLYVVSESSGALRTLANDTQWFSAEGTDSNLDLGIIPSKCDNQNSAQLVLGLDSRYGHVWEDTTDISYTLQLSFTVN